MGLRDMLKKKGGGSSEDDDEQSDQRPLPPQQRKHQQPPQPPPYSAYGAPPPRPPPPPEPLQTPEFTFIRSDTHTQEVIYPPSGPQSTFSDRSDDDDGNYNGRHLQAAGGGDHSAAAAGGSSRSASNSNRRSFDVFRRSSHISRSASVTSAVSGSGEREKDGGVESTARRLSHRLHLRRAPSTSTHVPADLPEIVLPEGEGGDEGGNSKSNSSKSAAAASSSSPPSKAPASTGGADGVVESQWEKRATMLALENERQMQHQHGASASSSPPSTPTGKGRLGGRDASRSPGGGSRSRSNSAVSSKEVDANIQEAIRLHEEGDLEQSTRMFGILADPRGYNNPLSQVLYGLALRHGWGCAPDTEAAVGYLSAAASNAAAIEDLALQAGLKKGGAAKGELVLAIFELANCFRHGWGLDKDPIAAKQYYETAANLGDTGVSIFSRGLFCSHVNSILWLY